MRERFFQAFIMQIDLGVDRAYILAAGFGTRMGEIGKHLPKPMWPIGPKSILELQIDYCLSLGINKIYINTHFLADRITKNLPQSYLEKVELLYEDPILDSGGCIHRLASLESIQYSGNVLVINADQFYLFDPREYAEALKLLKKSRAVLFGLKVTPDQGYNEIVCQDHILCDIVKVHNPTVDYITFSGVSLINLEGLARFNGPSKFFEKVCDYKSEKIYVMQPEESEYWDFGTAPKYLQAMIKLMENKNSEFLKFLEQCGLNRNEFKKYIQPDLKSVDLEGASRFEFNMLRYKKITQQVL